MSMNWLTRLRQSTNRGMIRAGFSNDWFLMPLAAIIGVLGGLVATGFDWTVHEVASLFFSYYGRSLFPFAPSLLLIALPAFGGLLVGVIQVVSRTGHTHGIPEVMEAFARKGGHMPLRMGVIKFITASITIGSGGSAGVEAPIIMSGSVLGSVIGQGLRVGREHMNTLVGCGAAAGLSGIFHAPIAGMIFVLEVMLRDFSFKTFIPIVIASVLGTVVAQAVLGGNAALFNVPEALRTYQFHLSGVVPYMVLGALCGLMGVAFTLGGQLGEKFFHYFPGPLWVRPVYGAAILGVLGIIFVQSFGNPMAHYAPPLFFSNGYPVTEAILDPISYGVNPETGQSTRRSAAGREAINEGEATTAAQALQAGARANAASANAAKSTPAPDIAGSTPNPAKAARAQQTAQDLEKAKKGAATKAPRPVGKSESSPTGDIASGDAESPVIFATIPLLFALAGFKLVGTLLTLSCGGSGGIIEPTLFMGASLGGGFGMCLRHLGLVSTADPAAYALAGMAGVIAAAVHCPLTALLLVFEITQDYKIIVPVMLVAIIATVVAQFLYRDSVYTGWLRRHGIRAGMFSDMTLLRRLTVADIPLTTAVIVRPGDPAARLIELAEDYAAVDYVVCDEQDQYVGMVVGEDVRTTLLQREAIPLMIVGELMRTNLATVNPDESLDAVLDKFSQHEVSSLAVLDGSSGVKGVISRSRLMKHYQQKLISQG